MAFSAVPEQKQATLVSPSGERVAVPVGTNTAQQYFGQGYKLETAPPPTGGTPPLTPMPGQTPGTAPPAGAGTPMPAPGGAMPPGGQGSQSAFLSAFAALQGKGKEMAALQDQKNKILLQLYDRNLSEVEIQGLSPAQQAAIRGNDKKLLEYQVMTINDAIRGRTDTNMKALDYMLQGYNMDLANAEQLRKEAEDKKAQGMDLMLSLADKYDLSSIDPAIVDRIKSGTLTPDDAMKISSVFKSQRDGEAAASRRSSSGGGSGGGGGLPMDYGDIGGDFEDPTVPGFDQYLESKNIKGGSNSMVLKNDPEQMKYWRDQYDQFVEEKKSEFAKNSPLGLRDSLEEVIFNLGTVSAQKTARAHFENLVKRGDIEGAKSYIDSIAKKGEKKSTSGTSSFEEKLLARKAELKKEEEDQ